MKMYELMGYFSQKEMEDDVKTSIQRIADYFMKNDEDFLGDIGLIDIYFDITKQK